MTGRGACVNGHCGNKTFRALCFARTLEFDVANPVAKRRIASDWTRQHHCPSQGQEQQEQRILLGEQGSWNVHDHDGDENSNNNIKLGTSIGWYQMNREQAILKACQVMRDYRRPDRHARYNNNNHLQSNPPSCLDDRTTSRATKIPTETRQRRCKRPRHTLLEDLFPETGLILNRMQQQQEQQQQPIVETPLGVLAHDILSGRGALLNGHLGNERLRRLAKERKLAFDSGDSNDKRVLAIGMVLLIRGLDPPGRFLRRRSRSTKPNGVGTAVGGGTLTITDQSKSLVADDAIQLRDDSNEWVKRGRHPQGLPGNEGYGSTGSQRT